MSFSEFRYCRFYALMCCNNLLWCQCLL